VASAAAVEKEGPQATRRGRRKARVFMIGKYTHRTG
jgi:hypothetical protein